MGQSGPAPAVSFAHMETEGVCDPAVAFSEALRAHRSLTELGSGGPCCGLHSASTRTFHLPHPTVLSMVSCHITVSAWKEKAVQDWSLLDCAPHPPEPCGHRVRCWSSWRSICLEVGSVSSCAGEGHLVWIVQSVGGTGQGLEMEMGLSSGGMEAAG